MSKTDSSHLILAYYQLVPIKDPFKEVAIHKSFLEGLDATCRIYISEQGINGQASFLRKDAQHYIEWMEKKPEFRETKFKLHSYHEHVFPRQTIKYRKKLVAFDADVDLENRGESVSPQRWKELLETENNRILLDIRNDYEWKIGNFKGAELPPCETFRDFSRYADQLKETVDAEKTPVMMYCTGGIRCELFSSVLKQKGFEKVYQLDGGIINYGLQQGNEHWQGKLFVFDDRMAIPISEENSSIIGECHFCKKPNDAYYNCANMDCNFLFLCCQECLNEHIGCCSSDCTKGTRVRPYHQQSAHKPFRRWYHYSQTKEQSHEPSEK